MTLEELKSEILNNDELTDAQKVKMIKDLENENKQENKEEVLLG